MQFCVLIQTEMLSDDILAYFYQPCGRFKLQWDALGLGLVRLQVPLHQLGIGQRAVTVLLTWRWGPPET